MAVAASFLSGGLVAAWVRQADINALRSDLELARVRENRLEEQLAEVRTMLWAERELE